MSRDALQLRHSTDQVTAHASAILATMGKEQATLMFLSLCDYVLDPSKIRSATDEQLKTISSFIGIGLLEMDAQIAARLESEATS